VLIEPGRCVVDDFGVLVSSVMSQKARGGRSMLFVDAGGHLVNSRSSCLHLVELVGVEHEKSTVDEMYGSLCVEADLISPAVGGPDNVPAGSKIQIGQTGAYDISTASSWMRPAPAIVGVVRGELAALRHAEASNGRGARVTTPVQQAN
jgi:diaminopimelate decarboxylase